MMDVNSIEHQHKEVNTLLANHRLKEALLLLDAMSLSCGDYLLQQELNGIQTSYNYMLQYMEQGMDDPERDSMYHSLLVKAYSVADQLYICLLDEVSSHLYHRLRKQQKLHPLQDNLSSILATLESFNDSINLFQLLHDEEQLKQDLHAHELALKNMFVLVWLNARWVSSDKNIAYKYLSSELITSNDLSLFVSAVTMSLLCCFDEEKLFWLLEALYHQDNQVKARAQVGFVLVLHEHANRISLYPGIVTRISIIQEEIPDFADDINNIYLQLLRSQDTERINKTMNEEIVPEVMKNIQQRQQKPFADESEEQDMNPEWMFDLGPKLNNKMRKIGKLQLEGGDINMATFSRMKGFVFFNEIHNWFYPFEPMHSEVVKVLGTVDDGKSNKEMGLLKMGMFCSSDCYSLIFMMQQLPADQRRLAFGGLSEENMEELFQDAEVEKHTLKANTLEVLSRFYIQDLYRFFKLSQIRGEFHSIFDDDLQLQDNILLKPLLYRTVFLRKVADLYFKTERFSKALSLYECLDALHVADKDIFQRMGYCHEVVCHDIVKAIHYYNQAILISLGNEWTLKHLASCYRRNGSFDKAQTCFEELLQMDPDNLNYSYGLGHCLMEQSKYHEALQCFFKMDLAEDNNVKAWRGIAWCNFMLNKLERAQSYYDKLLSLQPNNNDWLNAGHVAWCGGRLSLAIEYYRKAAGDDFQQFRCLYLKDQELMQRKGISQTDYLLMLDLI